MAAPHAPLAEAQPGRGVLDTVLAALEERKAEDIVSIDLAGKTTLADQMVVASGRSNRQAVAIAETVLEFLKAEHGMRGINVEGLPHGDWILIDASDVIVHIFRPEVREFYNIEKMWSADRPGGDA